MSTIVAMSTKSSTIEGCLRAAAGLSKQARLSDPTRNFEGRLADPAQRVINEQKRWEDMSNRREPAAPAMIDHAWEACQHLSVDSLEHALLTGVLWVMTLLCLGTF